MILVPMLTRNSIYIMRATATQHIGKWKVGVSNAPSLRAGQISDTIPGKAMVRFQIRILFAYHVEALLHFILWPFNTKMTGSGKTEWFSVTMPYAINSLCFFILLLYYDFLPDMSLKGISWVSLAAAFIFNLLITILARFFVSVLLCLIRLLQEAVIVMLLIYIGKTLGPILKNCISLQ